MFAAPENLLTTVFASVPDALRKTGPRSTWFDDRPFASTHSFLEGPSFDRTGNLWCVDMAWRRIFRIAPGGTFALAAEYDGHPNGLISISTVDGSSLPCRTEQVLHCDV